MSPLHFDDSLLWYRILGPDLQFAEDFNGMIRISKIFTSVQTLSIRQFYNLLGIRSANRPDHGAVPGFFPAKRQRLPFRG